MRLRSAEAQDGHYKILAGNATMTDLECEGFWVDELWVLGFTRSDAGIRDLFVAEVQGISEDRVPQLILGPIVKLISAGPPPPEHGFPGDEDDLDELMPGDDWEVEPGLDDAS
jgi:hypothetical protein